MAIGSRHLPFHDVRAGDERAMDVRNHRPARIGAQRSQVDGGAVRAEEADVREGELGLLGEGEPERARRLGESRTLRRYGALQRTVRQRDSQRGERNEPREHASLPRRTVTGGRVSEASHESDVQ
jgi:hypothetical protein